MSSVEEAIALLGPDAPPSQVLPALRAWVKAWHGVDVPLPSGHDPLAPPAVRYLHAVADRVDFSALAVLRPLEPDGRDHVAFVGVPEGPVWSYPLGGENPQTFVRFEDGGPRTPELQRVSSLVALAVLYETALAREDRWAGAELDAVAAAKVTSRVTPVRAGPFRSPPPQTSLFVRDGAIVLINAYGEDTNIWVAGRSPGALAPFEEVIDERWNRGGIDA